MPQLTDEQKQKYVDAIGTNCPYCGSGDISGASIVIEANNAYQPIDCMKCGKRWHDRYILNGLLEEDE